MHCTRIDGAACSVFCMVRGWLVRLQLISSSGQRRTILLLSTGRLQGRKRPKILGGERVIPCNSCLSFPWCDPPCSLEVLYQYACNPGPILYVIVQGPLWLGKNLRVNSCPSHSISPCFVLRLGTGTLSNSSSRRPPLRQQRLLGPLVVMQYLARAILSKSILMNHIYQHVPVVAHLCSTSLMHACTSWNQLPRHRRACLQDVPSMHTATTTPPPL